MDEGQQGSQYAIQIAVHTLRDRCKYLQQHVALLEEENVNLKIKCSRQEESRTSLNELDHLRAQVGHSRMEEWKMTKIYRLHNWQNKKNSCRGKSKWLLVKIKICGQSLAN